jgi:hypothetical protein
MRTFGILWLGSLLMVALFVSALTLAQTRPPVESRSKPVPHRIMSGDDLGFRVEGIDSKGQPVGTLVIRINGEWIEPGFTPTIRSAR